MSKIYVNRAWTWFHSSAIAWNVKSMNNNFLNFSWFWVMNTSISAWLHLKLRKLGVNSYSLHKTEVKRDSGKLLSIVNFPWIWIHLSKSMPICVTALLLSKLLSILVLVFFKSYYFSRQLLWTHTRGRCNTQGGRYFILELRITFRHTLNTFLNQFAKFWEDLLWIRGFWRHFLPSSISRKNSPNPFVALIQISLDSNYFLLSGELDKN